jgi:hypothetical protein
MSHSRKALIFTLAPIDRLARDFEWTGLDLSEVILVPIGAGVDSSWDVSDVKVYNASVQITRHRFDDISTKYTKNGRDGRLTVRMTRYGVISLMFFTLPALQFCTVACRSPLR